MCPHIAISLKILKSPVWYYETIRQFKRDLREFEAEERKGKQLELF